MKYLEKNNSAGESRSHKQRRCSLLKRHKKLSTPTHPLLSHTRVSVCVCIIAHKGLFTYNVSRERGGGVSPKLTIADEGGGGKPDVDHH